MKTKIGEGVLTWSRSERVSDRYGSVYLISEGQDSLTPGPARSLVNREVADRLIGKTGELVAVVTGTRDSTHIGDFFHGLHPSTPEVGEIIVLGTGMFFVEPAPQGGAQVGLSPAPDSPERPNGWWLDASRLYRAHEQTVQLFFGEAEKFK